MHCTQWRPLSIFLWPRNVDVPIAPPFHLNPIEADWGPQCTVEGHSAQLRAAVHSIGPQCTVEAHSAASANTPLVCKSSTVQALRWKCASAIIMLWSLTLCNWLSAVTKDCVHVWTKHLCKYHFVSFQVSKFFSALCVPIPIGLTQVFVLNTTALLLHKMWIVTTHSATERCIKMQRRTLHWQII